MKWFFFYNSEVKKINKTLYICRSRGIKLNPIYMYLIIYIIPDIFLNKRPLWSIWILHSYGTMLVGL